MLLTALASLALAYNFPDRVPMQTGEVEVPGDIKAGSATVKLHAFTSTDTYSNLVKYFADQFVHAGLFIPPIPKKRRHKYEPQLSALDPQTLRSYSVLLIKNRNRTVTIVEGVADLRPRTDASADTFVPVTPDAQNVVTSETEGSRMLGYETRLSGAEVLDFYKTVLGKAGWVLQKTGEFRKKDGTADLELATLERPNGGRAVAISARYRLTEMGSEAPADVEAPAAEPARDGGRAPSR